MANVTGTSNNDVLIGTLANDRLLGVAGNDTLDGLAGNDYLNGGLGDDSMSGGAGNDVYVVDSSADVIVENADSGVDAVTSTVNWTLGDHVENLRLIGTAALSGTGNSLKNSIIGNSGNNLLIGGGGNDALNGQGGNDTLDGGEGNDVLNGGPGDDSMSGGVGNDRYVVDSIADVIVENADSGVDAVTSSVTWTLGDHVENLTLSGTAELNGTGNSLNNRIIGNAGNNLLIGGDGNDALNGQAGNDTLDGGEGNDALNGGFGDDSMNGGAGNDRYVVDSIADVIIESVNGGTDSVQSSVTWTLQPDLENLTLSGTEDINGIGNTQNNRITGNIGNNFLVGGEGNDVLNGRGGHDTLAGGAGNDRLDGVLGDDSLNGGTGNDTYRVDNLEDIIVENADGGTDLVIALTSWTLGDHLENLRLLGSDALNGIGNSLNNQIIGNDVNNILDGGEGNDILNGGKGDDLYYVDSTLDRVVERPNAGIDTVESTADWKMSNNVENLTLKGIAISGIGNILNNVITGNTANNFIDGGKGDDTLIGDRGNDTYVVDSANDVIIETETGGIDLVKSTLSRTLDNFVEKLTLEGTSAINGTGNYLSNAIAGNAAANILNGKQGNDTLDGGAGDDSLLGDSGRDQLNGGAGNDTLTGGDSTDSFVFGSGNVFSTAEIGIDLITDFSLASGQKDSIVLQKATFSALTSNAGQGFSTSGEFDIVANDLDVETSQGLIVYSQGTGSLFYNENGSALGYGTGAKFATLVGTPTITAYDFSLIA